MRRTSPAHTISGASYPYIFVLMSTNLFFTRQPASLRFEPRDPSTTLSAHLYLAASSNHSCNLSLPSFFSHNTFFPIALLGMVYPNSFSFLGTCIHPRPLIPSLCLALPSLQLYDPTSISFGDQVGYLLLLGLCTFLPLGLCPRIASTSPWVLCPRISFPSCLPPLGFYALILCLPPLGFFMPSYFLPLCLPPLGFLCPRISFLRVYLPLGLYLHMSFLGFMPSCILPLGLYPRISFLWVCTLIYVLSLGLHALLLFFLWVYIPIYLPFRIAQSSVFLSGLCTYLFFFGLTHLFFWFL